MRILLVLLIASITLYANLFTISDKHGNVLKKRTIEHRENESLSQNATEYSIQAIYDALHREENLARAAQAAKEAARRIASIKKESYKQGRLYPLNSQEKEKLLAYAKYFKGGRYIWGGTTPQGFDCSGYVQYLYKKHHVDLPRTALAQSKKGVSVSKDMLKKGDLLFFLTDKKRGIPVTHVGIYIGNREFIHAASKKKGIIISSIDRGYYAKTFLFAKRILREN